MSGFTPYEGRGKYIFTSYSRTDTERMLEVMTALREREYRIWYDAGIPAGNDWPLYIAEHMFSAQAVIFFLSAGSLVSPNCLSEMLAAHDKRKPTICITLDACAERMLPAIREKRALTAEELAFLRAETAPFIERRKNRENIPAPEDWLAPLADAVLTEGCGTAEELSRRVLETHLIGEDFRGDYEREKKKRRVNGWLVAAGACVVLLLGLAGIGWRYYEGRLAEKSEENTAPAPTETPRPTLDPGLFDGFISSDLDFSGTPPVLEHAIRRITDNPEGSVPDTELLEIERLVFCGHDELDSTKGIEYDNGEWRMSGSRALEGEIAELSMLKRMYNLTELTLICQQVTSVAPLAELPALAKLDLSSNPIRSISLEGGFDELRELNLSHTPVRSLRELHAGGSLRTVYISADMASDMEWDENASYEVVLVR